MRKIIAYAALFAALCAPLAYGEHPTAPDLSAHGNVQTGIYFGALIDGLIALIMALGGGGGVAAIIYRKNKPNTAARDDKIREDAKAEAKKEFEFDKVQDDLDAGFTRIKTLEVELRKVIGKLKDIDYHILQRNGNEKHVLGRLKNIEDKFDMIMSILSKKDDD